MKYLIIIFSYFFVTSCGHEHEKKGFPPITLDGHWISIDDGCAREITFKQGHNFSEYAICLEMKNSNVSDGVWEQTSSNEITLTYITSNNEEYKNKKCSGIYNPDEPSIAMNCLLQMYTLKKLDLTQSSEKKIGDSLIFYGSNLYAGQVDKLFSYDFLGDY